MKLLAVWYLGQGSKSSVRRSRAEGKKKERKRDRDRSCCLIDLTLDRGRIGLE